jgi:hypothetical protein
VFEKKHVTRCGVVSPQKERQITSSGRRKFYWFLLIRRILFVGNRVSQTLLSLIRFIENVNNICIFK